jgi:hypothetical protein
MKNRLLNRTWISPLTAVTFLVVGITGILMAFHVKNGSVKALHEWIGYAFSLVGVIHLVVNWRTFTLQFRQRPALVAVLAGIILSLSVLFAGGNGSGKPGRANPFIQAFDLNGNGVIDSDEVSVAAISLNRLDANRDGTISIEEAMSKGGRMAKGPAGSGNPTRP